MTVTQIVRPRHILEIFPVGGSVWLDRSADLVLEDGLLVRTGNWQNGPDDNCGQAGRAEFSLRNDAENLAGALGTYSPGHVNCMAGFARGARIRIKFTYTGEVTPVTVFVGKLRHVLPVPGIYGTRRTQCVAFDWFDDLARHEVREVGLQINKGAHELLQAIIDSMPAASQPVATDLDTGIDTFPVAFDDIGGGVKGLGLAADIYRSERGFLTCRGDGTVRGENRHARALKSVDYTFDGDMTALTVPGDMDRAINLFRVTIHPKNLGAAPVVLCRQVGGVLFEPGETKVLWADCVNPDNPQEHIGTDPDEAEPIVAGVDYVGNSAEDGSGSNVTANFSMSTDVFPGSVKFTITYSGAVAAYLTTRQQRGIPIYDQNPETLEASSVQPYGQQQVEIDMRYQDDRVVGQGVADYLEQQFSTLERQVDVIEFCALVSAERMVQALTRDAGDRVVLSEQVTGLDELDVYINGRQLRLTPDGDMRCAWCPAPGAGTGQWILDDPEASLMDLTTVWGYL